MGNCCLSHALPRDELENVLLACKRNLLSQQRLGERDNLLAWALSRSTTSPEGFWLVCEEHGPGWRVSVGGKSHMPSSQHAKTALLVELLERREVVSCKEKTPGLWWAPVHVQKLPRVAEIIPGLIKFSRSSGP